MKVLSATFHVSYEGEFYAVCFHAGTCVFVNDDSGKTLLHLDNTGKRWNPCEADAGQLVEKAIEEANE